MYAVSSSKFNLSNLKTTIFANHFFKSLKVKLLKINNFKD